ncbi:MAG: tetratricopeptide repeat protein [Planctomycetota bacterium]|nr:tetratricopeptide repeat protein [Planctomycetota bacterium]
MEPRGFQKYLRYLQHLAAAPLRATAELLGLFSLGNHATRQAVHFEKRRKRSLMLFAGLPAVCCSLAAIGLATWGATNRTKLNTRYSDKLTEAMAEPDAIRAQRLGHRVFQRGLRNLPSPAMDYCNFLAIQKDLLRANSILEKLAPDDAPGYPAAHLQRAIGYSNLLSQGANDRYLPTLAWHLKQAGDPSTEGHWLAWANYWRLTGQIDRSVQSLESVANINPIHWFSVADLYLLDGKPDLARRSLLMASNAYRLRLGNNPLSTQDRLQLVMAQARSGEYPQASATLQAGLELNPQSDELLRAKTQLDTLGLEQAFQEAAELPKKLSLLREIVAKSQDRSKVYQRAIDLYRIAANEQQKSSIFEMLNESLKLYGPTPSLLFAQSMILIDEGKPSEAKQKLHEAIKAFPDHGPSLNNLAWLLANEEPRDLDQAKELAQRAVASDPQMGNFHDTLGTIFLELKDWRSAIQELELALAQTPVNARSKIHAKLAISYEAIGETSLAAMHKDAGSAK